MEAYVWIFAMRCSSVTKLENNKGLCLYSGRSFVTHLFMQATVIDSECDDGWECELHQIVSC